MGDGASIAQAIERGAQIRGKRRASAGLILIGLLALKNTLLVVFSTIFALLVAEIGLRIFSPIELRLKGDRIVLPYYKTYEVSFENPRLLEPYVTNSRNSLGFRGPDPHADMSDVLSIVAVGGSTTECFALSNDRDWPSVLGRLLKENFRDAWVNNAGLNGHTTRGHVMLLEQHLLALKPKVILFLVGLNDANYPYNTKIFDDRILHKQEENPFARAWQNARRWLMQHSDLLALMSQIYRQQMAKKWGFIASEYEVDFWKVAETATPPTPQDRASEYKKLEEADFHGFESRFRKLVELTRGIGAVPVFMTQPGLAGNAVDPETGLDLSILVDSMSVRTELFNEKLLQLGRELDVFVIDVTAKIPKSTNLYYDLWHYSDAGARVVGEAAYDSLCPFLAERFPGHDVAPCAR